METNKINATKAASNLEDLCLRLKSLSSLIGALDSYFVEGHAAPPKDILCEPARALEDVSRQFNENALLIVDYFMNNK